ncbi:MAG: hypothetical protein QME81_18095 [bacterium]|nr:hypothetical protein [bacterium]
MPRLTIEFPDKASRILTDLAQKDQTTKVEVIRRSIALYNYIHREAVEKNKKLSITDDNDTIIEDIVFS